MKILTIKDDISTDNISDDISTNLLIIFVYISIKLIIIKKSNLIQDNTVLNNILS